MRHRALALLFASCAVVAWAACTSTPAPTNTAPALTTAAATGQGGAAGSGATAGHGGSAATTGTAGQGGSASSSGQGGATSASDTATSSAANTTGSQSSTSSGGGAPPQDGGGGCVKCSLYYNALSNGQMATVCAGKSATLWAAFDACICGEGGGGGAGGGGAPSCSAACGNEICMGKAIDGPCTSCIVNTCQATFASCGNDQ